MGDEKHPNEDYVHAEASRPPRGTALPPDVSAVAHAEHAQEGQSLGAADVGVSATGTGDGPEREDDPGDEPPADEPGDDEPPAQKPRAKKPAP